MKILLTGASGMVGRNFLEIANAHWKILTPTRMEMDLSDRRSVKSYIHEHKPDMVIHAAGKVGGISANVAYPYEFLKENLEIGLNIISESKNYGVPNFLNLASSCIYPKDVDGLLTEDLVLTDRLEPTNEGYAIGKIAALKMCEYISKTNQNLKYKTIIPCNLFGRYDKFSVENAHLIPAIINKISHAKKNRKDKVVVWGDGEARREFMYAGDFSKSLVEVVKNFENIANLMNLGVGKDHSIIEYYRKVSKIMEWDGHFELDLTKPAGMKRKLMSVTLQRQILDLPSANLERGISQTVKYYEEKYNEN